MNATLPSTLGFTPETLARLNADPSEPTDMPAFRRAAGEIFTRFAWPRTEDEAWRRTDISGIDWEGLNLSPAPAAVTTKIPAAFQGLAVDTDPAVAWSSEGLYRKATEGLEAKGVIFSGLADALRKTPNLVWSALGRTVPAERGKFAALSAAFWNRGIFVYVPKGVDAGTVLRAGYAPRLADREAWVTRTLVVVEPGARLTLVEDQAGETEANAQGLSVSGVEILVGENAEVTYVNFQRHAPSLNHFSTQNAAVSRDGRLTTLVLALGGGVSRADFGSDLLAPGAESRLYGLVFGEGGQRFTHHTRQNHLAPHTTSDLLFKAALQGRSRSIYTGMIRIDKTAVKANAYQAAKNILLSREARANAIPMLEILTDDVKCGHGAAVGSLDDDQRFYLMSRGLDRTEAERAMVEGFFEDVLQKVPVPGLPEYLRTAIDRKLAASSRG